MTATASSAYAAWIERLRAAIEHDLASPGPNATNFADGRAVGKFFDDAFMWRSDPEFRAAAAGRLPVSAQARPPGRRTNDL